jgi:hypothetical protein
MHDDAASRHSQNFSAYLSTAEFVGEIGPAQKGEKYLILLNAGM